MSGVRPDKSDGVQILTIILFTGRVWSKTEQVQKMSLEAGKGTGQVRSTGLALKRFNRSDRYAKSVCPIGEISARSWNLVSFYHSWNLFGF
jgi:hypothetical protein